VALYVIQTTLNPGVDITVDDAEYERLHNLGLILNDPVPPEEPTFFDDAVAALINDTTSATWSAGKGQFTLNRQSVAPSSPYIGQVWVS
jgi:hypothetical protein